MILTVAIPTYNRPDKVKNTLLDLIPQLNDEVKVMILDNCSDINIKDYLVNFISDEHFDSVKVIRHKVNIGGDANFSRCFELCDTPYIWTLGDDDKVAANAIALILEDIKKYKDLDLVGINFSSNNVVSERKSPVFLENINDFVYKLDSFGNCETLSTSVYKTEEYSKYLYYASWGTYSMASQFVPAIMSISKNKVLVLSEKYIVTYIRGEDEHAWSDFQLALGISSLLELPIGLKKDEYKAFGRMTSLHFDFIFPITILYSILKSINFNIDNIDNYHIYIFKILSLKGFEFRTKKIRKLCHYIVCLFLLKNKSLLKLLLRLQPGFKEKAYKTFKVQEFRLFKR